MNINEDRIVEKLLCLQSNNSIQFTVDTEYTYSIAEVYNINGYYILFELYGEYPPTFRGAYLTSKRTQSVIKIFKNCKKWGLE